MNHKRRILNRIISAALAGFLILTPAVQAEVYVPNALPLNHPWLAEFSDLPESIAVVEDFYEAGQVQGKAQKSSPASQELILLVEDQHSNFAGQLNIAKLLNYVIPRFDLGHVFLEGGTGNASLSHLRNVAERDIRIEIATGYLKRGLIHGSEYASLVSTSDFELWGVEDQELYEQSLKLYAVIEVNRQQALESLGEAKKVVHFLTSSSQMGSNVHWDVLEQVSNRIEKLRRFLQEPLKMDLADLEDETIGDYYQKHVSSVLNKLIRDKGLSFSYLQDREFRDVSYGNEDYFALLKKRDLHFVDRMLSQMQAVNTRIGMLIIGKYHHENVKQFLREKNISYISIQPQATQFSDLKRYERLLFSQALGHEVTSEAMKRVKAKPVGSAFTDTLMMRPITTQETFDQMSEKSSILSRLKKDLNVAGSITSELPSTLPQANLQFSNGSGVVSNMVDAFSSMTDPKSMATKSIEDMANYTVSDKASASEDASRDPQISEGHYMSTDDRDKPWSVFQRSLQPMKPLEHIMRVIGGISAELLFMKSSSGNTARYEAHYYYQKALGALASDKKGSEIAHSVVIKRANEWYHKAILQGGIQDRMNHSTAPDPIRNFWGAVERAFKPVSWNAKKERAVVGFLKTNLSDGGLPLSFNPPEGFWFKSDNESPDVINGILERQIMAYSVSIYDAATWQIALALTDYDEHRDLVDSFMNRLQRGRSGSLHNIRASDTVFTYGDEKLRLDSANAYYFRIISDRWTQPDPLDGKKEYEGFPNMDVLHHEDWKPITGEQAWAAMIGPLQAAYFKYDGRIPLDAPEVKIALNILPAFEAMKSPIGALYHAVGGTHGKHPKDISNENNISALAGLRMLKEVLEDNHDTARVKRVEHLIEEILRYFREYTFDPEEEVFNQGGFYIDEEFIPTRFFAVDCQTWTIAVLGPEWIDREFGEGTAYRIWKNTKRRSGRFDSSGKLEGVGFTDSNSIVSVEWTAGAILTTKILASYYEDIHPDWAKEVLTDSISMRYGIEKYKTVYPDGRVAYWYASKRFFIPFGWWASPIPCLVSSAWVVMLDRDFNPFVLGGGTAA